MEEFNPRRIINILITSVWFINGLFCKVLNLVPRHEQIVERVLGSQYAPELTKVIGFAEILMGIWILSGYKPRLNILMQIIVIATMNTIEFILAPDLLLWGRLNSVFALLFILLICFNGIRNPQAKA